MASEGRPTRVVVRIARNASERSTPLPWTNTAHACPFLPATHLPVDVIGKEDAGNRWASSAPLQNDQGTPRALQCGDKPRYSSCRIELQYFHDHGSPVLAITMGPAERDLRVSQPARPITGVA